MARIRPRKTTRPPNQIVAEVNDTFGSLADKLGIDQKDLITANPDTSKVSAGAAYNVPPQQADFIKADAALYAQDEINARNAILPKKRDDETIDQFLDRVNSTPTTTPTGEPRNFFKEWINSGGGEPGKLPGDTINDFLKPVREFFFPNNETGFAPGVGQGAGIGIGKPLASQIFIPPPQQPPPPLPPQQADFRQAEAEASYRDREAQFMKGTLGISDITDKPGYYGFYGTEQDIADQAQGDFSQIYNPAYNPNPNFGATLDVGDVPVGDIPPLTAEATLRNMWEDVYLNPENKGRGGGIVGWIEERTGIKINPETFFAEGASAEVLAKMLEEFRPDELAYLESQGILVADEGYALPNYNYPASSYRGGYGSGGYGSGPSQPYPRNASLGLVSWSI